MITELHPFHCLYHSACSISQCRVIASVMADTQIHYNFINNTVSVSRNVVLFLGKNVVV